MVQRLLRLGCDPNNTGSLRVSPLHLAAHVGNLKVVEILLGATPPPDFSLVDGLGRIAHDVSATPLIRKVIEVSLSVLQKVQTLAAS